MNFWAISLVLAKMYFSEADFSVAMKTEGETLTKRISSRWKKGIWVGNVSIQTDLVFIHYVSKGDRGPKRCTVGRMLSLHIVNKGSNPSTLYNTQSTSKRDSWVKNQEYFPSTTRCGPKQNNQKETIMLDGLRMKKYVPQRDMMAVTKWQVGYRERASLIFK